jgi:hypothetical protein
LPHQLTGNYYQDFLLYDLKKLMEDAWCMHDGILSCLSLVVWDGLNNT